MMTSTFPTTKSDNSIRNRVKEIQSKKETLTLLEQALKQRINELKELCLKEGELTGDLPIDYPLQPREPIPQIRRRVNLNHFNNQLQSLNHHKRHYHSVKYPSSESTSESTSLRSLNLNSVEHFQPYYEETKPFQMSDYYKYSSKHRQRPAVENIANTCKTTRQLQEDVSRKNSLKFSSCDEQIQASVKLIERSGQKLLEATAKAIASNPGLADKLNNIYK